MSDLERLKDEYLDREQRFADSDIYSLENPAYQFARTRLYRAISKFDALKDISRMKVLEVGCGNGNVLAEFQERGAKHLLGVDYLLWRLQQGHNKKFDIPLACADGQFLPFSPRTFDLIIQFTMFSSILDEDIKRNIAHEMRRLLKPTGVILWYDFFWNPFNRQTRGIGLGEIKRLFSGMQVSAQKETLAPPITRRLIRVSSSLCIRLESLQILNSHYLALIKNPAPKST
jgi:ubiquinone/menaquinone biosynthesis C-methylase UbiE